MSHDMVKNALQQQINGLREQGPHCTIRWSDNKQYQVVPQDWIQLSPSEEVMLNHDYKIKTDSRTGFGKVLAIGSRQQCESVIPEHADVVKDHASSDQNDAITDLMLEKILDRLLDKIKSSVDNDVHNVSCSACKKNPIRQMDRYHCLECPEDYDLCAHCFEKHRQSDDHLSGHAMIHFKLPNEFLGINVNSLDNQLSLKRIEQLDSLRDEHHQHHRCDGNCREKYIVGLRFKCDTCPQYDLCQACALKHRVTTKNHQNTHPIILTSDGAVPQVDASDVEFGDRLGGGAFGTVFKAHWKSRNREIACKVIKIQPTDKDAKELEDSFFQELSTYRELFGHYIVRTYAYAIVKRQQINAATEYMLLMELMRKGSLQSLLKKEPHQLSLRQKLSMASQIASAMRRIHEHGIIHRDIRPDNILVTHDYIAKIGDMGIAWVMDHSDTPIRIGCEPFMPPEFFEFSSDGRIKIDQSLDAFTYGLTINELFTEVMHDFVRTPQGPRVRITKQSPIFFEDMIRKCISEDKKLRPTSLQIEQTLQFYERAFFETTSKQAYRKMSLREKDEAFLNFYREHHQQMQKHVHERIDNDIPARFFRREVRMLQLSPEFQRIIREQWFGH